eukprot:4157617-Pyramimonas_sp.AAC.1
MGAWAVVMTIDKGGGHAYQGILRGELKASNSMSIEPDGATSTTLECLGILYCLFRILAERPPCPISISSDSLTTIRAAKGGCLPASDRQLAQLVQVVWDMVREEAGVTLEHVKAHCGHPWNVLADNAAKITARSVGPAPLPLPSAWVDA